MKMLYKLGIIAAVISNSYAAGITNTSATATTFKFTATLDAPLPVGNKVKIDFGKGGLKTMMCSAKTNVCTLSSNVLPSENFANYQIGVYNSKNVLQGSVSSGNYIITSSTPASRKTNFSHVISAASTLKNAVETCALSGMPLDATVIMGCGADGSNNGIPADITVSFGNVASITTSDDGRITATAIEGNGLSGESYILVPTIWNGRIIWYLDAGSTCIPSGLCPDTQTRTEKFSEVIASVSVNKIAVEKCAKSNLVVNNTKIQGCGADGSNNGITADISVPFGYTASITTSDDGTITATAIIGHGLSGESYILVPAIKAGKITWYLDTNSTCRIAGLC